MFRLEAQENPLDMLVAGSASAYAQKKISQNAEQQDIQKMDTALSGLNEQSSTMDWVKAINRAPEKYQDKLFKIQENVEKGRREGQKSEQQRREALEKGAGDEESVNTIAKSFGPEAAKVWKASTQGGRTELLKTMLDAQLRGENVAQLLSGANIDDTGSPEMMESDAKSAVTGEFQWPKLDAFAGLKPSEKPHHREMLRKENLPIFNQAVKNIHASETEDRYVDILEDINESGELPEGLGRLIINPSTKEPFGLSELTGRVNSATQRWMKTINDFTLKAKDYFPGRVTNFDIQQFKARLPGLLNTADGRRVILKQMKISNKINTLYDKALQEIYQKYGADKVTPEQANEIAERKVAKEKAGLEKELLSLGQQSDKLYDQELGSDGSKSGKMVTMYAPDGEQLDVPENEVQELLKAGAVIR